LADASRRKVLKKTCLFGSTAKVAFGDVAACLLSKCVRSITSDFLDYGRLRCGEDERISNSSHVLRYGRCEIQSKPFHGNNSQPTVMGVKNLLSRSIFNRGTRKVQQMWWN
jgi:hypothetical protein